MRKLVFVSICFMAACSSVSGSDAEFKNPIFNQPLRPMSIHSGYVYLTPTSIKFMTPLNKELLDATGQCELIENEENFVKLFCKVKWQKIQGSTIIMNSDDYSSLWYCTYEIKGMFSDTCIKVEKVIYEITKRGNEKLSTSYYCIAPSSFSSESD